MDLKKSAKRISAVVSTVVLLVLAAVFGDKVDFSKDLEAVVAGDVSYAAEQFETSPNAEPSKPDLEFESPGE
jgi:hypothetical protein